MMETNNSLTAVSGFRVGHVTDLDAATGCTVIICPPGTIGGIDQRGGAPGTRETDLLRPLHQVQIVNAIVLAGGSAYGLASADGVIRYLEEHQLGYVTGTGYIVPIVSATIVFDLAIGRADVRPDSTMGYAACLNATTDPVVQGTVGAGTGCRIGAMYGGERATKGGVGSACIELGGGLKIAALAVVNAVGDVIDEQGGILAGLRNPDGVGFRGIMTEFRQMTGPISSPISPKMDQGGENTVIGVVATNARLDKNAVNKIAQMAHDGLARAINPAHTMFDGDTIFGLASGEIDADVNLVGAFGAQAFEAAIRSAVRSATGLYEVRAWNQ